MKIKSLKLKQHSILGDLDLDFTNKNGDVYNTIIFMGENGCGKTTILEILHNLFIYNNNEFKQSHYQCDFELDILLSDEELTKMNQELIDKHNSYFELKNNDIKITNTYNLPENKRIKISDCPEDWERAFITHLAKQFLLSVYSPVHINFNPRSVSAVTSLGIDEKINSSLKASEDISNQIKQLFVDISSEDASELQIWVDKNPNSAPPDKVKNRRIKRFKKAFNTIFNGGLNYDKVKTNNGAKEVYFNNNGDNVSIDDLSSGEKQIVFRGGFLLQNKGSTQGATVLIDEPEISMHLKWQENILDFYKQLYVNEQNQQTSQIFITSHSEYMFTKKTEDDVIIILKKDNNGKISAQRYEPQCLPYESFAEIKYLAFNMPTIEFFNELYGYVEYRKNKIDNFIQSINSGIDTTYNRLIQQTAWLRTDGTTRNHTFLTCLRHKIHHPENNLNHSVISGDKISQEDLKEAIDFLIYLIQTFSI